LNRHPLSFAAFCEFIATAFLIVSVVGSGIAAERLSGGIVGLALLANALATGGALFVLILTFGPLSGAHMNPMVTLGATIAGEFSWRSVPTYVGAQIGGGICGTFIAHIMFELPVLQVSQHVRTGPAQWVAEVVATSGLLAVIWGSARYRTPVLAGAVGAYIAGAYWFTASTSFANPAVTIARAFTDTFAGIRPADVAGFVIAQAIGLAIALPLLRKLSSLPVED
jgi:glycerol uptake facilitator-like aquaporin